MPTEATMPRRSFAPQNLRHDVGNGGSAFDDRTTIDAAFYAFVDSTTLHRR